MIKLTKIVTEMKSSVKVNRKRFKKGQAVKIFGKKGTIIRFAGEDVWTIAKDSMIKGDTWYVQIGDETPQAWKFDEIEKI